jgi:hypothetical protein
MELLQGRGLLDKLGAGEAEKDDPRPRPAGTAVWGFVAASFSHSVMAGLVPAIHVFVAGKSKRRGCPDKPGHDDSAPRYFFSELAAHFCENSLAFFAVSGVRPSLFLSRSSTDMMSANAFA